MKISDPPSDALTRGDDLPLWKVDLANSAGFNWLRKGASLLRAARILERQVNVDLESSDALHHQLASLNFQVAFLGALAAENAFKAVLSEQGPLPCGAGSGRLPAYLKNHDLSDLANKARVLGEDLHERDALKYGKGIIEWMGRYQTPVNAAKDRVPTHAELDSADFCAAYQRLFFRAADKAARLAAVRWHVGTDVDVASVAALWTRVLRGTIKLTSSE